MNWFSEFISKGIRVSGEQGKSNLPEGLWSKCGSCGETLYSEAIKQSLYVCRHCNHHMYIRARDRLNALLDEGTQQAHFSNIESTDPLTFVDRRKYKDRLVQAKKQSQESDALVVMTGKLEGMDVTVAVFEYQFMAGSMGSAVGEKFVRAVHFSMEKNQPLICFTASGGARMQEGLFSLMQMSKTAAAISRLKSMGIAYICVLTNPTMGGVSASLGMLGHVQIAEPGALIGFAGPRVIEQTVNQVLPKGFQRSEFLLENGAIDAIVDRRQMKTQLALLLSMLAVKTNTNQNTASQPDYLPL